MAHSCFLDFLGTYTYNFNLDKVIFRNDGVGIFKTRLGIRSTENSCSISIFSRLSSRKIRWDITRSTEPRSATLHENRKLSARYIG